jgi:hypothetical protein
MESSDDSGYVKEPLLIFVSWQLCLQHKVATEVEEKNDVKVNEEEEMEDASVLALVPHEESNFNKTQHAMEEDVQHQQVEDAPVGMEVDVGRSRMIVPLSSCRSFRVATCWLKWGTPRVVELGARHGCSGVGGSQGRRTLLR